MDRKILFGCIFLGILYCASARSFYTLVAPEVLKAGTDYSAAITLHYNSEPAIVKVGIYGPSINSTKTLDLGIYNTGVAKFDIPALEHGIYKLKVQGVKGMIFGNVTELKCDYEMNVMEDMEQLVKVKVPLAKNETFKRMGLFNTNKDKSRRIGPEFNFAIESNDTIPYLIYTLVVNGKIHSHKYLEVDGNSTTEYIVLTPTADMKPLAYLYVYFIKNDELVWLDNWIAFVKGPSKNESQDITEFKSPEAENLKEKLSSEVCIKTKPGELSGLITLTNAPPSQNIDHRYLSGTSIFLVQQIIKKCFKEDKKYQNNSFFSMSYTVDSYIGLKYISALQKFNKRYRTFFVINLDRHVKKSLLKPTAKILSFYLYVLKKHNKGVCKGIGNIQINESEKNITLSNNNKNMSIFHNNYFVIKRNKEKIKNNILSSLHFTSPPNIKLSLVVPSKIIENFNSQLKELSNTNRNSNSEYQSYFFKKEEEISTKPLTFSLSKDLVQNFKKAFLQKDQHSHFINYDVCSEAATKRNAFYQYKASMYFPFKTRKSMPQKGQTANSVNGVYFFPKCNFLMYNFSRIKCQYHFS